jgi:hypothetical protein
MKLTLPSHLSDTALVAEVKRLGRGEREATVQLILHLAELERRRLFLPTGYSSLYKYCRAVLLLSEPEAYIRMMAARLVRRHPKVRAMLLDGSLNLTTLRLLVAHLKAPNWPDLLDMAANKSKREVAELLARLFPKADVPASIRPLPPPAPPTTPTPFLPGAGATAAEASVMEGRWTRVAGGWQATPTPAVQPAAPSTAAPSPPAPAAYRPPVTPLAAGRYQITFTASGAMRDRLECARDMLRHAVPDGNPAEIFDRALTALLRELARKKFAATDRPRPSRGCGAGARHIPASVKREVWVRDCGRCTFVAPDGRRCEERGFVQFHHDIRRASGGPATVENLSLKCGPHNRYLEDVYQGTASARVQEGPAEYGCGARATTGSGPSCVSDTQGVRYSDVPDGQSEGRLEQHARAPEVAVAERAAAAGTAHLRPPRSEDAPAARRGHASQLSQEEGAPDLPLRLVALPGPGLGRAERGARGGGVADRPYRGGRAPRPAP